MVSYLRSLTPKESSGASTSSTAPAEDQRQIDWGGRQETDPEVSLERFETDAEPRYLGTCVAQPSTTETLAVIVPVAVAQAEPWSVMEVGIIGSSYVHPFFGS